MASCSFPHPIPPFPPAFPYRPYSQVPDAYLDQRTQQTSPQMPQVLRHRLQSHRLPQNSNKLRYNRLTHNNVNSKLPRMPTTSGTSDIRFRCGRPWVPSLPPLKRWFLPPGGGAGRESPGPARVLSTWACARARPGRPLGLWAGPGGEGRRGWRLRGSAP